MTMETWTIIGAGAALSAMRAMRRDFEQRVSKIEGLLEAWLSGAPRPPLPGEDDSRIRA